MTPTVETFDTAPFADGTRVRYWNSALRNVFDAIEIEPTSRHFAGRMRRRNFGTIQLATVDSTPVAVHGGASSKLNGIYLMVIERGSCNMRQRGRDGRLQAGELTVLCAHEPYLLECSREHRTHVLYIPGTDLDRMLDERIAQPQPGANGELLTAFVTRLGNLDTNVATGDQYHTALNLLRLTWPEPVAPPTRTNTNAWRQLLYRHVEQHLCDPELNADRIAAHFGISSRYVQLIFSRSGTTLTQYILGRRLHSVAERLRQEDRRRICDIALEAGFNDVSNFCRRFRDHFGVSARDYRARHFN